MLGLEFEVKFAREAGRSLGPTQHPMQWSRGLFILGLKFSRTEAIHLSESSAILRMRGAVPPRLSLCLRGMALNRVEDNLILPHLFTLGSHKVRLSFLRYMCIGISVTLVTLRWTLGGFNKNQK